MERIKLEAFDQVLDLGLSVQVGRVSERIGFDFLLEGEWGGLKIPPPNASGARPGTRKDKLWEHTCFEGFFGIPGQASYWELNVSPSGDWNLYRFDGYREGMRAEAAGTLTRFQSGAEERGFRVAGELALPALAGAEAIEASFTAVLEPRHGEKSYWALAHRGEKPDFHRRDSFVLTLRK